MVTQPEQGFAQAHLIEGNRFSTNTFADVVGGGTLSLLIENPSDSGVWILLDPDIIRNRRLGTLGKLKNVTVDAAGTEVDILNKNAAFPDNSEATASEGATVSGGSNFGPKFIPGGGTGEPVGGGASAGASNILSPGDNLFIEYTNQTTNDGRVSIDIDWTELRESFFPPTP